jgi:2-keto-4-pentenoate hydratase/2-oxohepta-3-ene-1,7-dioic acid hydratase in catechol pathway
MRLVTYAPKDKPTATQVGILEGGAISPVKNWQGDLSTLIAYGVKPEKAGKKIKRDAVYLRAPLRPGKIICVGRNYGAHAAELGNTVPEKPLLFSKFPSSVIGDGQFICWHPTLTEQVDWEGELAVVLGLGGWNIPEAEAMDHVYGYTVANDVSARDLQSGDGQWTRAKGLDTFAPLGPCILTADAVPDPHNLTIKTTVNGEVMQNGSTGDMIYNIPQLIAHCSRAFTWEPGDVLLTGTPSGVGKGMTPPRFLNDGDEVSVTIDPIGTLTNPCMVWSDD